MSNGKRGPGPIPNRWLYCPRKSDTIIAEKFLAFKTPLNDEYTSQMPPDCIFLPDMVFSYCKFLKLKIGLWVDLTYTKRFYDRSVVETQGAKYVKLQCRGHGETPSPEQTQAFIEIVDNFINEKPLDIIAVHCTHGFNRTGFLIASYLVERLDCSVEAALAMFAAARSPGIYKQDYINELYRRYEDEEYATPAPALPDWCLEFDDSDRGNNEIAGHSQKRKHEGNAALAPAMPDWGLRFDDSSHVNSETSGHSQKRKHEEHAHSSNSQQASAARQQHSNVSLSKQGSLNDDNPIAEGEGNDKKDQSDSSAEDKPRKKRRRELNIKNAKFMEGVPGVKWVHDQPRLGNLQQKVQAMCGWNEGGFPGCQPVSMDYDNLIRLHEIPYRVSWKADGTRYMMLINKRDEIYFFDRNNSCFQIENLSFVKSSNLNEHLENTLVDGEMVLDKYIGEITPRYLIYDVIKFADFDIGKESFSRRLLCIKKELIDPRIRAIEKGIICRPSEPFSVRRKDFWDITKAAVLLGEKFAKSLPHEPDGLIFQPEKQPYIPGVCPDVLKWKPFSLNSVDFRMKIQTEEGLGILKKKVCNLYVGGCDHKIAEIPYTSALKHLDNKIVECSINDHQKWKFMRERPDKTLPNSFNTAKSVIQSIAQPITKEKLLNYIAEYGFPSDKHMMPPPHNTQQEHANKQQQLFRPQQMK